MPEKFGQIINVKGMSPARKRELFDFLVVEVKEKRIAFKREHTMLTGALGRTKGWDDAPALIYILAETVWQAFKEKDFNMFYITDVSQNAVYGLAHKKEK